MRRLVPLALSLSMLLGLSAAGRLLAQDEKKAEAAQDPATKTEEAKKETPAPAAPAAPKPIPPEVQQKIDAARKAVAEAIAAAEAAGLVETTIDPPPILDILVTGRADDAAKLKARTDASPEVGVSPEVFGAWFTGFGKLEGVTAEKNVRIVNPSKGLTEWYRQRATVFNPLLAEARKNAPKPATEEPKPAEETKPAEDTKKDEAKPAEDTKKDEAKPADEPKKDEAPKEEARPAEEKKGEEPKAEEVKKEGAPE